MDVLNFFFFIMVTNVIRSKDMCDELPSFSFLSFFLRNINSINRSIRSISGKS